MTVIKHRSNRQTDWQGERDVSFPSEALLPEISISITRSPPGRHPARSLGGRSRAPSLPAVVSVKRRIVMPLRRLPSAALVFRTCEGPWGICMQLRPRRTPSPRLAVFCPVVTPPFLCQHLAISERTVIKKKKKRTNFNSCCKKFTISYLKGRCVTFTGICWQEMEKETQKCHRKWPFSGKKKSLQNDGYHLFLCSCS